MNIVASALGHYEIVGNPADADVVIGHSFGTSIDVGSPNQAIADFILQNADGRPVVADRTLVNAFPGQDAAVDHPVEGPVSNGTGSKGVGTWGTLVEARKFMKDNQLHRAVMVGQANHIGRIMMQARKLGVDAVAPPDLPTMFDPRSEQPWTRSLGMWVPREVAGWFLLRAKGQV